MPCTPRSALSAVQQNVMTSQKFAKSLRRSPEERQIYLFAIHICHLCQCGLSKECLITPPSLQWNAPLNSLRTPTSPQKCFKRTNISVASGDEGLEGGSQDMARGKGEGNH
uniref:Uncharacterized protein n=1 Tax=Eutreptiella gymnastica TaxID=73025 RepID=A0A7S1NEE8_9EUGL|mmetsp:Transcript_23133/g.41681  ORF Transcript_23133/g.41681 Transcript_23133/m.41681 type:complete len:111 (+) Transcript_23133:511-843(+)